MNLNHKIFNVALVLTTAATLFASCNKSLPEAQPNPPAAAPTGSSIIEAIRADLTNYSILDSAIKRAGPATVALLNDKTATFTFFAPTNTAFAAAGITNFTGLSAFTPAQLQSILSYHFVPGIRLVSDSIRTTFPNMQLPTGLVLAPPSATLPPGLRNSVFVSRRGNIAWVNNIPITQANIAVANGVVHNIAALLLPPSQFLWNRIDTDPNLTYLKAAIQRADTGIPAGSTLQEALLNPAASLTIFAPTNTAFQQLLTPMITQALIPIVTQQLIAGGATPAEAAAQAPAIALTQATALASTPAVFSDPALGAVLTPQTVRGIVVYHLLGVRAFSVNLPTQATNVQTLLNSAVPAHPGVSVMANFAPSGFSVSSATVRGAANPAPSNVQINPTPAPGGTSDQHYINGVIHIIDQVLRPQ